MEFNCEYWDIGKMCGKPANEHLRSGKYYCPTHEEIVYWYEGIAFPDSEE